MSVHTFRKKPVVIEALHYDGHNVTEISAWMHPVSVSERFQGGLIIPTLEGDYRADIGDWIIRGVAGEFYPCKPPIFDATYEPVEQAAHQDGEDAQATEGKL